MRTTSHAGTEQATKVIVPVRPTAGSARASGTATRGLLRRTLGRYSPSRRTLGISHPSRRTLGRYSPSRRTLGRYNP